MNTMIKDRNQFLKNLKKILKLLQCSECGKFIQNPVSLKCNHRFCEKCVLGKIANLSESSCIECESLFQKHEIMHQTQLKIYIIHLKELISTLDKAKFFDDDLFEKFYAFVFRNHPFADTVAKCCFEDIESNSRSDEKINKENELIDYETTMIETQLKTNLVDETVQEELNDQTFSDNELDDKKVIDASLLTIYSQTETEYKKQETNLENTQKDSGSDGIQEQQSMETFSNPFKISQSKSFLSDSPEFDFFDSDSDDEDLQPIF
ncbi:hypothetical protein NH340_JMT01208 [Sarcoptes scabiei]|nr:hypothetical protein NH340_JMT01208 [Sarcoptes scabiei]